jgi:hypothetical protein
MRDFGSKHASLSAAKRRRHRPTVLRPTLRLRAISSFCKPRAAARRIREGTARGEEPRAHDLRIVLSSWVNLIAEAWRMDKRIDSRP